MSEDLDCHHPSPAPRAGRDALTLERAAAILRAAGDVPRLQLLERLHAGEACVSELAQEGQEGLSTVSQRLKVLLQAGLVRRRRDGKHVYYGLADDHVFALLQSVLDHAEEG